MKTILSLGFLMVWLVCAGLADAATLSWDSVGAPDIAKYRVYVCETAECTVVKSASTLLAEVSHVVGIARQSVVLDLAGKSGALAVTALDNASAPGPNESGLSVQVPFDRLAPPIPANPILQ